MLRVLSTRLVAQRSTVILSQNFASSEIADKCSQSQAPSIPNVPGLSDKVLCVPNEPVGFAGAAKDKEYKNPEYYCYHTDSFGDSFVELEKYRLPAPDSKKPLKTQ